MKKIITLLLLFTITLANLGGGYELTEREKRVQRQALIHWSRVENIRQSEFTPELLQEYLQLSGLRSPEVVYQQAVLETGWFTHIRCTEYNNYFGMKEAKVREHCQSGVWKKHAIYRHWTFSVDDYKLWQEYWEDEAYDQTNYYSFLGNVGYAVAKDYVRTLKQI